MRFTNETFADEIITLDDNSFIDCNIVQCDIVYEGTGVGVLANCIIESARFSFTGAAARTLDLMSKLYANGGASIVEATFEAIRSGNTSPGYDVILGDHNPGAVH